MTTTYCGEMWTMEEVDCIQEQEEMPIPETSRKPSGTWGIKSMWYRPSQIISSASQIISTAYFFPKDK